MASSIRTETEEIMGQTEGCEGSLYAWRKIRGKRLEQLLILGKRSLALVIYDMGHDSGP